MLIEAARRAETATKEMLAAVADGTAGCDEIREALAVSRAIAAVNAAFQAEAAAAVAGRERHGDGGAEVLAASAGLSRQEARSHIKTAEALNKAPRLRDALASGRLSPGNARRLAEAVNKTGADAVASNGGLLANAETMRPEQFAREARRWVIEREGDSGASEHARQRSRRQLRVWDGDDGMVHLHGEFDTVSGTRIANRLRACASQLHSADRKNAKDNNGDKRSFDQCMADALDQLTATDNNTGGGRPFADICVVAHVDEATGKLVAELPDRTKLPDAVLEELACNARLTGVIYDRKGKAIWRAESVRCATDAQRQILIARDGGCFGCGAHPGVCDAHHVRPVSQGGPTKIDNLVLACWRCHHKIHHLGWQIHGPPGHRSLHPPNTLHYGPAHAPDQPVPTGRGNHADRSALFNHGPGIEATAPFDGHSDADEPAQAESGPGIEATARFNGHRDTDELALLDPGPVPGPDEATRFNAHRDDHEPALLDARHGPKSQGG